MKLAFFLFLFTIKAYSQIVFIDINNNPLEKNAAISAAKKAGKSIVVYPKGSELFDKEKAFEILKKNPPETLFISGHDGGGSFSGDRNEEFSYSDIKDLASENPSIAENLRVLGLLGCNTANHHQIQEWKQLFPEIAFVAGYDGSAPLGTRKAGHAYIEDIILKSDQILKTADEKKLKNIFENFQYINQLQASLYADLHSCQAKDNQYIYRPQRFGDEKFKLFDTSECLAKREKYKKKYKDLFFQYFDGEKEIPANRSHGELREMYTYMNQNEHCFADFIESSEFPSSDTLRNLLFYKDVHENMSVYYKDELKDFFEELKIYGNEAELKKKTQEIYERNKKYLEKMNSYLENYALYEKDLKSYISKEKERIRQNYPPEFFKKYQEYQEIVKNRDEQRFWRFYNAQSDEFKGLFMDDMQRIEDLEEAHKEGKSSYIYTEFDVAKYQLESDIKDYETNNDNNVKRLLDTYQRLPAKDYEDFKKLSRKELPVFTSLTFSFPLDLTSHPDFTERMKRTIENVNFRLDDEVIPFNWHDSHLGEPLPVKDISFRREIVREQKNNEQSFEKRHFVVW